MRSTACGCGQTEARTGEKARQGGRAPRAAGLAILALLAFAPPTGAAPVHKAAPSLDVPSLNHACGAATDSKADVYAASAGEGKIEVFAPASHTTPIAEIANANEPCALAVQSDGTLYVSERATGEVVRYEPSEYPPTESVIYDPREAIDSSGEAKGIAVDRADDRLYVAEGDHVAIYDKEGAFQANAGEGDLTQATGVSAYTYIITGNIPTNLKRHYYLSVADAASDQVKVFSGREDGPLKLRRTISGVDEGEDGEISAAEEFGFGAQGAYLAADPGNESRETRACVALAEQACTQGHFYLYDAANEAVDEFDATGEFLDQLKSAAFEDAEPTAMAIERSGAASDGTLYVSAGKGAGAKLLAFAPLHQPSRAQFEEPASTLSKKLKGAKAVAVDCSGYVYVAAESLIRVYSPAGVELSSAADTHNAQDLAADCEGNVYVVDKSPKEMTYYSPSKYPPEAATTYTRHEPGLLAATGLNAVAVNPADDHSFLVGEGTFTDVMVEFGPVSEGTPEVGKCGAGIAPFGNRVDVDVYAKTGQLYVSANPSTATGTAISTLTCGAESELLIRQIKGGGCPDGEPGAASAIAVDQSNGHIVQFAPGQPGASAREYDSAGACVAQFGTFGENNAGYKVAVDSSCALHEPPLSEQTTPTCAEFDPANGNAYVAYDATNNKVQPYDVTAFGPLSYGEGPETATDVPDGFGAGAVTLKGTVNPHKAPLESCTFEYLTDAQYQGNGETFAGATSKECADLAGIGAGETPVAVHAVIEGLETETTRYRFRLRAENAFGEGGGEAKGTLFGPPAAMAEPALPVLYGEATLRGEVDPSGLETSYRFQYLSEAQYQVNEESEPFAGAAETPLGHVSPGEDPVAVKAPLTGLAEGTAYRFRLVAENDAAKDTGPEESFETLTRAAPQQCPNSEYRTGLSAFLPDCRAYELVTPAQTLGPPSTFSATAGARFFNSWFVAPRGPGAGESVAFYADVARVDGKFFRAQRGEGAHPAGGWGSEMYGLDFLQEAGGGEHAQGGVSADQRYMFHGVREQEIETEQAFPLGNYMRVPAGQADPECTPEPRDVFEVSDPAREFELVGCGEEGTDADAEGRFIGAGGTHVIFTSEAQLEEGAPAGAEEIYDREAGSSHATLVSVLPDESPVEAGEGLRYLATTEDGASVVFGANGSLYARRGGTTTEIAAAPNTYAGISEDGRRVFFIDKAYTPSLADPVPTAGLFACDIDAGPCAGEGAQAPVAIAEDAIFVNVSADGSHAFFTSEEALTGGEKNDNGKEAQAGEHNLYAWDGATVHFVATLDPADLESFRGGTVEVLESLLQWTNAIPGQRTTNSNSVYETGRAFSPARSTPDGGVLIFQSHAHLTGYDSGERGEIYRYDPAAAAGERLLCVSCNPSGAPHLAAADALLQIPQGEATEPDTLIPNVTDDGQRVIFESFDALVPEDANEVSDVYEWQAPGYTGPGGDECKRAGGCLALISSGHGEDPSQLFGMDADGSDVFFVTREELAGGDVSGSYSIYDAREGGGIPNPPTLEGCQGDACQPPGPPPPALATPASTGPGEDPAQSARRCAKGKHRVKGRCVKKHAKGKRHRKQSRKKSRAGHHGRAQR